MSVHTYGNQQPINQVCYGCCPNTYALGKRFNDHQDVNLISGPVSVQACTKCSYVGNDVNDMICAVSKDTGSPDLTNRISRYEVAIRSEQEPRGLTKSK